MPNASFTFENNVLVCHPQRSPFPFAVFYPGILQLSLLLLLTLLCNIKVTIKQNKKQIIH